MNCSTRTALFTLILVVFALTALPGCIKAKQHFILMPDGSGKMLIRIGFNASALEGFGGGGDMDNPTDIDFDDLNNNYEGFVAFTEPRNSKSDEGWQYVEFDAYFENINDVKLYEGDATGEERQSNVDFNFEPAEGGFLLILESRMGEEDDEMADVPEEQQEMVMGMMQMILAGFEYAQVIDMPGEVTEAENMTSEARTATFKVSQSDLDSFEKVKAMGEMKKFTIRCGPSQLSAEEIAAFKEEMAAAKAAWEEMKAKNAPEEEVPEPEDEAVPDDGDMK